MSDPYKRLRAALAAGPTPGRWKMYKDALRPGMRLTCRELQDAHGEAIIHWAGFDNCNKPKKEQDANLRYFSAAQPEVIHDLLRERDDLSEAYTRLLAENKRLREGQPS